MTHFKRIGGGMGRVPTDKVNVTFAKGASLDDSKGLFNSSRGGNTRRAVDIGEEDVLDEKAFVELIRAAVALSAQ